MIDFKVAPDDGKPFEVKATTRDVLAWEKTTKGASLKQLMDELHMADMYKVAFFASRRNGLFTGTQKEFEETVDLEFEMEDEDADPS